MEEKKYNVIDANGEIIARDMIFDYALVFVIGFRERYYMEPLELTIKECERVRGAQE